jgi:hypothetical protein
VSTADDRFSRTPKGRYRLLKYNARRTGNAFNITFEAYRALIEQPCFYCGHPLSPTGNGLDRKTAGGDYTLANVVPCCGDCNTFKHVSFTHDEMVFIGRAIGKVKSCRL